MHFKAPSFHQLSSPTTYFWYRETLDISPEVEVGGSMNGWITLAVLAAWLLVFLCVFKGISTSGKVRGNLPLHYLII